MAVLTGAIGIGAAARAYRHMRSAKTQVRMRSHIQILVHLWSPPPPPPPGESVKPTLSSERKKTPLFDDTRGRLENWRPPPPLREEEARQRAAFFVACPAEFFAGPTLAGHARNIFAPHARTSLSLSRACVRVRASFPCARGYRIAAYLSLSLSPLSFVSYTEAGRERERDTRRWRRWRRAMFIEGRKIDGAGGRREARQPFFSF